MPVNVESLIARLGPAALALLPRLVDAIRSGDHQAARDTAEEMARRELFEARQRAKAKRRRD